jgi:hypothetical protein
VIRRILFLSIVPFAAVFAFATAASATSTTTINPANAPTGTHFSGGTTATCSVDASTQLVTCSPFVLAGVGNSNATGSLVTTYTATVDCTNHGGMTVPVKSSVQTAPTSTGSLSPKNGKLTVPSLNSSPVPTAAQFEASATCPNPNWTKSVQAGSITLSSFTYKLTFAGFSGPYITITGNDP